MVERLWAFGPYSTVLGYMSPKLVRITQGSDTHVSGLHALSQCFAICAAGSVDEMFALLKPCCKRTLIPKPLSLYLEYCTKYLCL